MKNAIYWQAQDENYEEELISEFPEELSKERKRAERRKKTAYKKQRLYRNSVVATKNLDKRMEKDENCKVHLFVRRQIILAKKVSKMEA